MFRSYLIISIRSILKQKIFSVINVTGLAIGISASLIIFMLVQYDFSFDRFHKNADRIYRVVSKFNYSGETFYNSGVTWPLSKAVQKDIIGIEHTAPFFTFNSDLKISVDTGNTAVFRNQSNAIYANAEYFRIFEYDWIAGSPGSSLNDAHTTVLTEPRAALYFPGLRASEIIGKTLTLNDTITTRVTGVVHELQDNTDLAFSVFVSWSTLERQRSTINDLDNWTNTTSASQLFIKLEKTHLPEQVEKRLAELFLKYAPPDPAGKQHSPFLLQPLSDIHFNANYGTYFDNRMANKSTMYGLLIIAAFILVLGCINFINLSTAQASQRAKEIGIRKTIGSSKKQLIGQFLAETFVLTLLSTLLSIALTPFILRAVKEFVPSQVTDQPFMVPGVFVFLVALSVVVTLLTGFYPAWVLSGYKPAMVLKNSFVSGRTSSALWLRKTLTVTQFVIAQVFIVAVITVGLQLRYTLTLDPGFKRDAIIHFQTDFDDTVGQRNQLLLGKLKTVPGIQMVSLSNNPVAATGTWSSAIKYKTAKGEIETHVQMKMGDTNYLKLYELKLLAGRNLRGTDSIAELIINQTYASALGFTTPAEAIGKQVYWDDKPVPIAGVVADFHQQSLHTSIKPLAIGCWPVNHRTFNIALAHGASPGSLRAVITRIKKTFKEIYPEDDFEYSFQDDTIRNYYDNEVKTASLLKYATGVTILISCLGLLGLTIYSTNRRTKEIGIRKVFGASILQVVQVLSKDFLLLVVIGFIIAVPLSWWAASMWLKNFAYSIEISWWVFAITFFGHSLIAMLTVAIQTTRSAVVNPVKSLKME